MAENVMTNVQLLKSVMAGIRKGQTFPVWAALACREFGVFQNPLEKRLSEALQELVDTRIANLRPILIAITNMPGFPTTCREKEKSPVLAAHFTGQLLDFNGNPVSMDGRPMLKKDGKVKVHPLGRFKMVGQGKADKKYARMTRTSRKGKGVRMVSLRGSR